MSKKLLVAVIAAVGGVVAYRKVEADREAEQDLWAEVDRPPPEPARSAGVDRTRGRSSTGRAPPLQGGG